MSNKTPADHLREAAFLTAALFVVAVIVAVIA